jgi:hypothetical protein
LNIEKLDKTIEAKGVHGISGEALYEQGLRYLFGVEDKLQNLGRSIELFQQALNKGEPRAAIHLEVAQELLSEAGRVSTG